MSLVGQRRSGEAPSIANAIFAGSILLASFLPFASPSFRLTEFAPPQVIYSRDLAPLLLAPWTSPSSVYRILSRLLQSDLLFRLPKDSILPCYFLWITIALLRTFIGFQLSHSVGWTHPHLFNHWALYEPSGGCGPSLVAYLIVSGVRPDLSVLLLLRFRGYRWEVTELFIVLAICALLAGLDHAPWTYSIAIGLAMLIITFRAIFSVYRPPETSVHSHPSPDPRPHKHFRRDIQTALLLLCFIPLLSMLSAFLTSPPTPHMPSSSNDTPLLEILMLSYPRPNDIPPSPDQPSILSQTIASYLPYVSSATALSVFTHASPSTHTAFTDAQRRFKDAPITFYSDQDVHPDAQQGQHLHLAEAFRWIVARGAPEWVMLVEDDFPICAEWGWQGVLHVMQALEQDHAAPSSETTKIWGGFVGTGGSGLILHRTLLPILASTLRLHALARFPFPPFMAPRPADIIIQDCLLGVDPLCPTAPSSLDRLEGPWVTPRQPSMVITSRLVMDHIGGHASTVPERVYRSNWWSCGWRHPFHGRPEVMVIPV